MIPFVLSREGGASILLAAQAFLGREGRADQSEPWTFDRFEVNRNRESALLSEWASERGLWVEPKDLGKWHRGRREHDIFGDGFTRLCEATWFRAADHLANFDVGGSNLFATDTGELVPIDVMPIVARGELLSKLHEALEKVR